MNASSMAGGEPGVYTNIDVVLPLTLSRSSL